MTQPVLSLRGVSVAFGPLTVVSQLSLELRPGESFGLVGESGSGKTMVGLAAMRLVPDGGRISTGTIRADGIDITGVDEASMRRLRGRTLAMVLQDPLNSLNPTLTIATQMVEAIRAHAPVSEREARARARDALGKVGIANPEERLDAYPHQFSGGMRQRVAIATAMINRPKVLIADEPTTALDVTTQAQILAEVRTLCREEGTALLWISHDLAVVSGLVERVGVMYAGQLVETGSISQVLQRPRHPYTHGLIGSIPERTPVGQRLPQIPGMVPAPSAWPTGCRFAPRCFRAAPACDTAPAFEPDAAHAVRCHFPLAGEQAATLQAPAATREAAHAGEPLLTLEGAGKTFRPPRKLFKRMLGATPPPPAPALADIDLTLRRGEVLGIVGESGSGKSTLARILAGMMQPDAGSFRRQLQRGPLGVQMIFQDAMSSLNPRQRIGQAISEAPLFHGLWTAREAPARLADLLAKVGIDPSYASRYPHQFSGGQRQRIAIARALAVEPEVLICDEAVASLDVSIQAQIINMLADLRQTLNLSYIFIGHDLGLVRHVSDRVAVMHKGRIVEQGPVQQVLSAPAHPYTRSLLEAAPSIGHRAHTAVPAAAPSPAAAQEMKP